MAKARVVKFCISVEYIKCYPLDDKLLPNWGGQGHVTYFLNWGAPVISFVLMKLDTEHLLHYRICLEQYAGKIFSNWAIIIIIIIIMKFISIQYVCMCMCFRLFDIHSANRNTAVVINMHELFHRTLIHMHNNKSNIIFVFIVDICSTNFEQACCRRKQLRSRCRHLTNLTKKVVFDSGPLA